MGDAEPLYRTLERGASTSRVAPLSQKGRLAVRIGWCGRPAAKPYQKKSPRTEMVAVLVSGLLISNAPKFKMNPAISTPKYQFSARDKDVR
jgi:hypothetical protein